jgi:hypothetical protein
MVNTDVTQNTQVLASQKVFQTMVLFDSKMMALGDRDTETLLRV